MNNLKVGINIMFDSYHIGMIWGKIESLHYLNPTSDYDKPLEERKKILFYCIKPSKKVNSEYKHYYRTHKEMTGEEEIYEQ